MMKKFSVILAVAMAASIMSNMFSFDASANVTFADMIAGKAPKPSSSSSSSSSSTSKSSSSSSTSKTTSTNKTASTVKVSGAVADIKKVCGLKSDVEKSVSACIVDVDSKVNPYDVVYDYGKDYDAFVAKCDWSLVFDADYYMEQFPMLALQYHNDKDLLLKHFQTVGIQEGRQGNKKFNVGVYKANCAKSVSEAFGKEYEGYYFYYMLNYSSQKSVKTTAKNSKIQQTIVKTALQASEFKSNNQYRKEAGVSEVVFSSEAAAFANYRAWTNAHDNWRGHTWLEKNKDFLKKNVYGTFAKTYYCENLCERTAYETTGRTHATCYRNSAGHYKTLTDSDFDAMGVSNSYATKSNNFTVQVDTFAGLD